MSSDLFEDVELLVLREFESLLLFLEDCGLFLVENYAVPEPVIDLQFVLDDEA